MTRDIVLDLESGGYRGGSTLSPSRRPPQVRCPDDGF